MARDPILVLTHWTRLALRRLSGGVPILLFQPCRNGDPPAGRMNRGLPDNMPGDHTAVPADQTMNTPLIVHPLADVREHLVEYGRALRERVEGIEGHTVFRELIRRHLVRATEGDAIHLVHADEVLVMAFIPAALAGSDQRDLHQEAERTALALLDSDGPPMPIELVSAQIGPPAVEGKCRLEAWLEGDLLDVLEEREEIGRASCRVRV